MHNFDQVEVGSTDCFLSIEALALLTGLPIAVVACSKVEEQTNNQGSGTITFYAYDLQTHKPVGEMSCPSHLDPSDL